MPTPNFLYFDLGNVLLKFSHERAARQIADVSRLSYDAVWRLLFETADLQRKSETGELDPQAFHDAFCQASGARPAFEEFDLAHSDIFELNTPIMPLLGALRRAGHRLGILSNTNRSHWRFVTDGRYGILPSLFEICVLSYEVGVMKPAPEIYRAAAEKTGVPVSEIFYADDREDNVQGALEAGFDAVLFTEAHQLAGELRRRGLRFDY